MATPTFEIRAYNTINEHGESVEFDLNGATTVEAAVEEICDFFEDDYVVMNVKNVNMDYTTEGRKAVVSGMLKTGENVLVAVEMLEV